MQKLQLSIPEPCHENWQQMTATEQGRFCNACAKEVIDFSMLTDAEVLNYFNTRTYEKVCGRALPDQLNRTFSRPKDPKKKIFGYWKYMVMFFMFFAKTNTSKAQGQIQVNSMFEQKSFQINNLSDALAGRVGCGIVNAKNKINTTPQNGINEMSLNPGMMFVIKEDTKPVYIIDGILTAESVQISSEDIEEMTVLQAQKATALYGSAGANGAILITTRKSKSKNLDTVIVKSNIDYTARQMGGFSIGMKISGFSDLKASLMTILTDSIQVYPNPVQRNNPFSVTLKLKQTGKHQIQITDVSGKIVLQKQINTNVKNSTEKILADNRWSSGIYFIRVFDDKLKLISKKSFIFQ